MSYEAESLGSYGGLAGFHGLGAFGKGGKKRRPKRKAKRRAKRRAVKKARRVKRRAAKGLPTVAPLIRPKAVAKAKGLPLLSPPMDLIPPPPMDMPPPPPVDTLPPVDAAAVPQVAPPFMALPFFGPRLARGPMGPRPGQPNMRPRTGFTAGKAAALAALAAGLFLT